VAERGGLVQTVVVVGLLVLAGGVGYVWRAQVLQNDTAAATDPPAAAAPGVPAAPAGAGQPAAPASRLGDLSPFRVITQDTLTMLNRGDQSGATTRITDLETAWDDAQARLKPRDNAAWTRIDGKIDKVLRELRSTSPNPASEKDALNALLAALG
jgi:hypothetical protein